MNIKIIVVGIIIVIVLMGLYIGFVYNTKLEQEGDGGVINECEKICIVTQINETDVEIYRQGWWHGYDEYGNITQECGDLVTYMFINDSKFKYLELEVV